MTRGLDHITYHVGESALSKGGSLELFLSGLGFQEVHVDEAVERDWTVRWWEFPEPDNDKCLHLVAVPGKLVGSLGYGHLCIGASERVYEHFEKSGDWVERDSGSGRLWLNCEGVRVELRCEGRTVVPSAEPGESPGAEYEAPEITDESAVAAGQRFLDEHREETTFRVIVQSILKEFAKGTGPTFVGKALSGCEAGEEVQVRLERPVTDMWPPLPPPGASIIMNYERRTVEPQHWVHAQILDRALEVYKERNETYKDNWKKQGWRGALFKLKLKVERAWEVLWDEDPDNLDSDYMARVTDDLIDAINNAAFAVAAVEEGNRDGKGSWF